MYERVDYLIPSFIKIYLRLIICYLANFGSMARRFYHRCSSLFHLEYDFCDVWI